MSIFRHWQCQILYDEGYVTRLLHYVYTLTPLLAGIGSFSVAVKVQPLQVATG